MSLVWTIPLYFHRSKLEFLHKKVFQHVLKGLSLSLLETLVEEFLDGAANKLLCPRVFSCLQRAKEQGEKIGLLSSSPLFLVEKIARKYSFDHWAGTEYGVDKAGKICKIDSLITGYRKREIASLWASEESVRVAYSDSLDDLPLLEWANVPIVVRPSRKLKEIALARKWRQLDEC